MSCMTHENESASKCFRILARHIQIRSANGWEKNARAKFLGLWQTRLYLDLLFAIDHFFPQKVQLLVTVIDYDRVGGNEPIGQVLLGAEQKGCHRIRKMAATPNFPLNMTVLLIWVHFMYATKHITSLDFL